MYQIEPYREIRAEPEMVVDVYVTSAQKADELETELKQFFQLRRRDDHATNIIRITAWR